MLTDLQWTWWPGIWFGLGMGTLVGFQNARKKALIVAIPQVFLTACFGIAAGEAAGFHVGAYAGRWFAVAIICIALVGLIEVVASKSLRTPNEQS